MNIYNKLPDKKKALSLISSAKNDMNYTLKLKVSEHSANTIVRNIYECFRMLGEAALINQGIDISDHVSCINELFKLKVQTSRPINLIESLRRIRHKINYDGYRASIYEALDAISIAKICFNPLIKEVIKIKKTSATTH